jgi:hypothetical protein
MDCHNQKHISPRLIELIKQDYDYPMPEGVREKLLRVCKNCNNAFGEHSGDSLEWCPISCTSRKQGKFGFAENSRFEEDKELTTLLKTILRLFGIKGKIKNGR